MSGLALRLAALEWVFQVISERALSIDPRVGARFRDISNHIAHMQADRTSEAECAAYERMVQDMAAACQAAMRPPALAEWLLAWFMSKAQRDDVLGDLEEEFLTDKLPRARAACGEALVLVADREVDLAARACGSVRRRRAECHRGHYGEGSADRHPSFC